MTAIRDLDTPRLLTDVTTVNFHPHLPHYELTAPESDGLRVLGRQRVDPNRPHPFTTAGNTEFNAVIWMPPSGQRAGDIVLIDSTHFTTLFGGTDSLRNLWRNLATMEQSPANRRPYEPQAASAEIAAAPRRKFAASRGIGSNWPGRA